MNFNPIAALVVLMLMIVCVYGLFDIQGETLTLAVWNIILLCSIAGGFVFADEGGQRNEF